MATHEIKVAKRDDQGKGASRRLRHADKIPAVVYGGELKPVSIELAHNDIWLASQNEWFYSAILDLSLDGDVQKVLLRDMQRHPAKPRIMHLDFQRVDENKPLRVSVSLHFLNQDTSPAGKTAGVVVMHELNEVEISCLPKDLPAFIEVDLANIAVGDVIHLSELTLPQGVEIPALNFGKEHDIAVVIARHMKEEAEPEGDAPSEVPAAKQPAKAAAAPAKPAPKK